MGVDWDLELWNWKSLRTESVSMDGAFRHLPDMTIEA